MLGNLQNKIIQALLSQLNIFFSVINPLPLTFFNILLGLMFVGVSVWMWLFILSWVLGDRDVLLSLDLGFSGDVGLSPYFAF